MFRHCHIRAQTTEFSRSPALRRLPGFPLPRCNPPVVGGEGWMSQNLPAVEDEAQSLASMILHMLFRRWTWKLLGIGHETS